MVINAGSIVAATFQGRAVPLGGVGLVVIVIVIVAVVVISRRNS
jgi:hypothetical protein